MRARQVLVVIAIATMPCAALAAEGDDKRGSTPPGISQDGSRPSEGAIKGGSLDVKKGREGAGGPQLEIDRCRDLEGTLRTQCIEDARKKDEDKRPTQ